MVAAASSYPLSTGWQPATNATKISDAIVSKRHSSHTITRDARLREVGTAQGREDIDHRGYGARLLCDLTQQNWVPFVDHRLVHSAAA
jgi:hypothetical protein